MKKLILTALIIPAIMACLITGCGKDDKSGQESESQNIDASNIDASDSAVHDESALKQSISEILDNEDMYPDIKSIDYNESFTEFTITLAGDYMNVYESMLVMSFYTWGNEKQIENGIAKEDALTVVRYVNGKTGDIVSESDSSSMVTE